MKMQFECVRCTRTIPFAHYVRARWDKPTPVRCPRCGAAHAVLRGETEVITPPMIPSDKEGRVSPWQLPWTRPVMPGRYECKFGDLVDSIFLWWTGTQFVVSEHDARAVLMRTFQTWRGVWG